MHSGKTTRRFRPLLLLLLAPAAQAQAPVGQPAQTEEARLAERIEQFEADIAAHREEITMLEGRIGSSEGMVRTIMVTRLDEARLELFDTTLKLADDAAEAREQGLALDGYVDDVTALLSSLPASAYEAAGRIRDDLTLVLEPETPGDAILADQQAAIQIAEIDAIFATLVRWMRIAPEFGIDTGGERERVAALLEDSAANRSVFLEIAQREAEKLGSAVATLTDDAELSSWLAAMEARRAVASESLESAVALMNRLDLDSVHYRQQLLASTGEITTDVLDVGFIANLLREWSVTTTDFLVAEGPGLLVKIFFALLVLFVFMQLGKLLQRAVAGVINSQRVRMSSLLQKMVLGTVRNLFLIIGIMIALSQLGFSLGPVLAGLGIAGFIIGFALQDSLSNFASGMMILIYRPFDVGDYVEVAGVRGTVNAMTLVNTTFLTIDNQKLVVPNNTVWQSVITNYTDQATRRVDLVFGISYGDDIDKAESVIREVLAGYDKLLEEPAPVVKVGELGESSVNLIVRPWVRTEDYWETYWDLTKLIKQAFDRAGITIPFPQRDLHVSYPAADAGQLPAEPEPLQRKA